jgi:hypothetical protein
LLMTLCHPLITTTLCPFPKNNRWCAFLLQRKSTLDRTTHIFPTAQRRLYHSFTTWTLRDLNFCTIVCGYASVLKRSITFCTTGINCHVALITSICCHKNLFL